MKKDSLSRVPFSLRRFLSTFTLNGQNSYGVVGLRRVDLPTTSRWLLTQGRGRPFVVWLYHFNGEPPVSFTKLSPQSCIMTKGVLCSRFLVPTPTLPLPSPPTSSSPRKVVMWVIRWVCQKRRSRTKRNSRRPNPHNEGFPPKGGP